ncbi:MAG TPA: VTT domain-containing protein [Candidatus Saccharimonadales bacterium]|nr:VTT domain-containing protein [Candidatus Saccharimonadales bacterium]
MLFGIGLEEAIQAIGLIGILAIVFAESGMMVGFFLPGDTLLFTAGFLAQTGTLTVNVHLLVFLIFLAAVAGDNLGYLIGHRYGRKLFSKPKSLIFNKENLAKAEGFYEKYGAIVVMIARFVPILRTFGPVVAGLSSMSYRSFLMYDLIGGFLWATSITYLGYFGGEFLHSKGIDVEMLVLPIVGLAVLLSIASPLYHIWKDPKSRQILLERLKVKKQSTKAD